MLTVIGALAVHAVLSYVFGIIGGLILSLARGAANGGEMDKEAVKTGASAGIIVYHLIVAFIFLVVIL